MRAAGSAWHRPRGRRPAGKEVLIASDAAQPERAADTNLDQCRRCDIWRNATCAVPGEGPAQARIMLVGEQPGDQEDLAGRPFIGPAGQCCNAPWPKPGCHGRTST